MTDKTGDPVHGAEFVEDGAPDTGSAVGLELDAAREVVGVDGVHEPEEPRAHEVLEVHFIGEALVDAFRVVTNKVEELLHDVVAEILGVVVLVFRPERLVLELVVLGREPGRFSVTCACT